MNTTFEAIYESGVLKLEHPLLLPDRAHVTVHVQAKGQSTHDFERTAWLAASEASLTRTWDNPSDDVFSELLAGPNHPPAHSVH